MTGEAALGMARSDGLRRKIRYLRGHHFAGRAARFRARVDGSQSDPDFTSVVALPDWILLDKDRQILVGVGAAILSERAAIDRELSGERLAAIAALVGDDVFERMCDCLPPFPVEESAGRRLPRPEDFASRGLELRRAAMPAAFRDPEISDAEAAIAILLCQLAADVLDKSDVAE